MFCQRQQEPRKAGVRHQSVAGAPGSQHQARHLSGQAVQQARLAHAGFTADHHHAACRPAVAQRLHFGVAVDHARWAQQGHGDGRLGWVRVRARVGGGVGVGVGVGVDGRTERLCFDGLQQRQGLCAGHRTHLVFEQGFTAIKSQHRSGAVTPQVVQTHDPAMRVFRERFGVEQSQGQRQRRRHVTRGFQQLNVRFPGLPGQVLAQQALAFKPAT